jgi:hypothetical protein
VRGKRLESLLGVFLVFLLFGCHMHYVGANSAGHKSFGEQWLSWSAAEQYNFVVAYTQGYETGMFNACRAVNDLSKDDDLKDAEHDAMVHTFPYERCRSAVGEYTKVKFDPTREPDVSAYTNTITEFYSKHTEYRNIPYLYLMELLNDKEHKTAEQIYSMARAGEIRTHW